MHDPYAGLVESWPTSRPEMSDHLRHEIAASHLRGAPLAAGEPVPGCRCETCLGLPGDHPARTPAWERNNPAEAVRVKEGRRQSWLHLVERARARPITEVAARLGCGDAVRRGRELAVRCPAHDDETPSCRLDVDRGIWYCDPCGEGGDGLRLWMRARRTTFAEAVRALAS